MSAQELLRIGTRKVVGNGDTIRIWEDAWLPLDCSVTTSARPIGCLATCVSDLWLPGSRAWNVQLVKMLFNDVEANAILAIPLSQVPRSDSWAWKFTPKGRFTVNSAYQLASRRIIEKYTASSLDQETWRFLWNLDIPAKLRIFLWRACKDILPATDALRARGLNITEGCRGCDAASESAFHAICECPVTRPVWDTGSVRLPQGWENCSSFAELFTLVSKTLHISMVPSFAYHCWLIWNNRNARIFDKEVLTASAIAHKAPMLELEFRLAQEAKPPDKAAPPAIARRTVGWKPPPPGFLKLNTDAASSMGSNEIGLGAVLRDSEGKIVWAMAHQLCGHKSPLIAEALAMRAGVSAVAGMGMQNVIMETDSLQVVQALANETEPFLSEVQGIIHDCLAIGLAIPGRMVRHTLRGGNRVAHELAKYSLSHGGEVSWFDDFPSSIVDLARFELARV